jgi:CBS domain-containing protein
MTENLQRATRWASWVGQAIAWLLIVTGIAVTFGVQVPLIGSGFGSGLWLAFIGWFLNGAAVRSYRTVVIQDILEEVPVEGIMRRDPPTCTVECSVRRLVNDFIMQTDEQSFPIVENGARRLAGIVTLDDVRRVPRDEWDSKSIGEIMTPLQKLAFVSPEDDAADALAKLTSRDVRQLPVVKDGALVGLLRRRDIVKWLQLHSELGGFRG